MQKTELNLKSQSILTLEAGTHEAVIVDGKVFVLFAILSGIVGGEDKGGEEVKETEAPSKREAKAPEVVDDTKPAKRSRGTKAAAPAAPAEAPAQVEEKPKATRSRRQPEPEPEVEETAGDTDLILIAEEEWDTLQKGDMVLAKLNMEGADGEKIWEAEVIGFQTPKGSRDKKLFVKFLEDGAEDYLRDGDQLFEYKVMG